MKYKAIIFDMDGTIIDTNEIWTYATRKVLENRGVTIDEALAIELSERLAGLGLNESCKIVKEVGKLTDEVAHLVKEKSSIACSLYAKQVRFMEGFIDFHKKISKLNIKSGLATNADDQTLDITNRKLNLAQFFGKHIYNISHVGNIGKPDPAIYLHTSKQLEIDPVHCIAIEDSAHGIKAAVNAGMFCIGLNSAKNHAQLKESHLIVETYNEINIEQLLKLSF